MFCRSVLSTTKSFKKPLVSSISTFKIRTISTLSIGNIVAEMNHHLTVEANTRMIAEATIIRMIDEVNSEVDFGVDQMINSKIVVRKDVLYVGNLIVDQPITRKTSAKTRKSAFSIDIHSLETIIVFVNTF